ncbi:MAG: beta-lactamase family protein [Gammaproteobacteria bacterium]|nr:beta-lactamase family protein [Gammaproteobacteria bacterium]
MAFVSILAIAVGCTARNDSPAGVASPDNNAGIDAIFAQWDVPGSPGCALSVARDGELMYSRGYGYANLDYELPITPHTVFDVASVTKQFVAALLTMLALDGTLSLDDDVREWLPELPEYDRPITLRHMLYHTSGLRDYLTLFPLAGRDDYYPISHPQILQMMSRQRALIFSPGEQYRYSNTAYMLLAQVIERAGGQSLGEFARERIFEPLGMNGSLMYDNREAIIPRRATGYDRDPDGLTRIVHNYNFDVAGDGQLYSTMEDLLRWDHYLHGPDKSPIYELMLTEGQLDSGERTGYGQGLRLDEYRGLRTVGHSGSSWGFRTELVRFVDAGLAIAISCNFDDAEPGTLAQRVADHYLADSLGPEDGAESAEAAAPIDEPAAQAPDLTAEQLREFAGAWFSPELDAIYRFAVVDGRLELRIEQESPVTAMPVAGDEFEFAFHPKGWSEPEQVNIQFDRNRGGAVIGFGLTAGSERGIVFEKH